MHVDVKVLGPLEVSVDGVSVVPSASKQCQILAMLALNAGQTVTTSSLIEEIWEDPPRTAVTTLQTYILLLRRKLHGVPDGGPHGSSDILVTTRTGYLLDVPREDVDAVRYGQLSIRGRRAFNDENFVTAARLLEAGLGLWRGPVLADVPTGSHLAIHALRLGENRLSDLGLRIDAELRLGRHHQLLGELATLCASHPLLENFCAQYMLALYRAGRPYKALEAYQRLRTTVIDELGIEPSPRLRHLHHAVLSGHPALDDPNSSASGWAPAVLTR